MVRQGPLPHRIPGTGEATVSYADLIPAYMMEDDVIRLAKLAEWIGVNPITLRRWVAAGKFPAPIRLSAKVQVYRIGELRAALAELELAETVAAEEKA